MACTMEGAWKNWLLTSGVACAKKYPAMDIGCTEKERWSTMKFAALKSDKEIKQLKS